MIAIISPVTESELGVYKRVGEVGDDRSILQRSKHFGILLRRGTYAVNGKEGAQAELIRYQAIANPKEGQKNSEISSPYQCRCIARRFSGK